MAGGWLFARLSQQMNGNPLGEPVTSDALTVIAALVHAGRPLTMDTLTTALKWPRDRTAAALTAIRQQPAVTDPFALQAAGPETYTLTARPDRLTPSQREALG